MRKYMGVAVNERRQLLFTSEVGNSSELPTSDGAKVCFAHSHEQHFTSTAFVPRRRVA